MIWIGAPLAATAIIVAFGALLLGAGLRAGDRPGDATVTAVAGRVPAPDGPRPVVVATIRNPGPVPVLVGLSAYRSRVPDWLGAGLSVTVPRRTARHRYAPGAQDTVGVVGPGEAACWRVPAPAGGRTCRLVAVVGQSGRLRVFRLTAGPDPAAAARPDRQAPRDRQARPDPLSWLGDG